MAKWFKHILNEENEKCFEKHKNADGFCYGLFGGDRNTGYLAESCIGCKYHIMPWEIRKKGE